MTRLAKHLGFPGYDAVRQLHADAMRGEGTGFAGKVGAQAESQKLRGDHSLAADIIGVIRGQIAGLDRRETLDGLVDAARLIGGARRIYCLGLRSSHSAAWHLHYILSLAGKQSIMLDAMGGIGVDPLGNASADDVLVAISVLPYTRQTVEITDYAQSSGVRIVAITDSLVAPLAQRAASTLIVPTDSPSFLHTMSSAFVVTEILGALVAGSSGDAAREALARVDRQSAALNTHYQPRNGRQ
jgi:DNA-binding MurR/RpiR family transcriptional regulator